MKTLKFKGQVVDLVEHTADLKVGRAMLIYEDPGIKEKPEGVAVLRQLMVRMNSRDPDFLWGRWEFLADPGAFFTRKVCRNR